MSGRDGEARPGRSAPATRREFLRLTGWSALGLGATALTGVGLGARAGSPPPVSPSRRQWAMVIDIRLCQQPGVMQACMAACHRTHNVPDIADERRAVKWLWSEPFERVFADQSHPHMPTALKKAPVLVLCNHCTAPPCVQVCPTKATWKRAEDGLVMMDMHRCIGCRYCIAACPYGARSFNWQDPRPFIPAINPTYPTRTRGVVEKCTFCVERLSKGLPPACVAACQELPGAETALTFGDLADPDSGVSALLREKITLRRRPALGAAPNVYYVI